MDFFCYYKIHSGEVGKQRRFKKAWGLSDCRQSRQAWGMGHGAWSLGHGAWSMGHGAWRLEHGAWSMALGAWGLGPGG